MSKKTIRALFDEKTIRVYQAFGRDIAIRALENQSFVAPFSMDRMTWIKPSFGWIAYRSGFASKGGQEFVLGVDIDRTFFDWVLNNSAPSINETGDINWNSKKEAAFALIQWDPDRDINGSKNGSKTIQIGIKPKCLQRYIESIKLIEDCTSNIRSKIVPAEVEYHTSCPLTSM